MKWNVHFGMRLTYDVEVEADTMQQAIERARFEWEAAEYTDMDYAGDDVDAWVEE